MRHSGHSDLYDGGYKKPDNLDLWGHLRRTADNGLRHRTLLTRAPAIIIVKLTKNHHFTKTLKEFLKNISDFTTRLLNFIPLLRIDISLDTDFVSRHLNTAFM